MKKILVIDDENDLREILRRFLTKAGFDVRTAANGEEGLQKFQMDPANLVITDLLMPDKEGIETIVELKQGYPDVKIIVMTGGGIGKAKDYLEIASALGVEHAITKPFSLGDLLQKVKEITLKSVVEK